VENQIEGLGAALRRIRQNAGLTLDVVARGAEVTKGYLSKIELGQATPSMHVLVRLTGALGVHLADLLSHEDQYRTISVVRRDERKVITRSGSDAGYLYELASSVKSGSQAEAFFLTIPIRKKREIEWFSHPGDEIFFVFDGTLRFEFGGKDFLLREGDCVHFDANIMHRAISEGSKPAKLFVVLIPSRPEVVLSQGKAERP